MSDQQPTRYPARSELSNDPAPYSPPITDAQENGAGGCGLIVAIIVILAIGVVAVWLKNAN